MIAQINFKIINPDFKQDYADEYNFGKEGDSNWKYNWGAGYELDKVTSVELINDAVFQLRGKIKDGEEINIAIPNVAIFRFHLENGDFEDYAVSKSIINKTHQAKNEKHNITRCYFYLNAEPESVQLGNNLVIDLNEMPSQLLTKSE
jgi:hypothetical protein